jgi:hypothetical protein
MSAVREMASHLHPRIADARTMRLAWDHLAFQGGQSPGPDGRRYTDYGSEEVWDLCKCLADAVRRGTYRPGPARIVEISKSSGGTRPLALLNIADRVVQRATVSILQPLLDPLFDVRSFGFRPGLGHLHALALGEYLAVVRLRQVWITQDIRDAFGMVPVARLLQVVARLLPDDRLLALLEGILAAQGPRGLPQGGPLSPLMLNIYLHHFLDRPWRRRFPRLPMLRLADDLLVACYSEGQATEAHRVLADLLLPAGMPLKHSANDAVHDLRAGVVTTWLGFNLSKTKGGLAAEIGVKAWDRLEDYLALAHPKSDSPVRAVRTILQWLGQRGPCYPWTDHTEACRQIVAMANQQGFEELPTKDELRGHWQRAHARWCKLRTSVRKRAHSQVQPMDLPSPARS